MPLVTFNPNTTILSADENANFLGLSNGSLDTPANSLQQFRDDDIFDHVISGMVWSGDAYASTRNASMTAGVVSINGRRIVISAVTARSMTASKDVYVDVLDNGDGTGTLVYTDGTTNAASPALAANSIRIAIVVVGAGSIAAATSINQGQTERILPIASSIPYSLTDSLGNLICNRSPLPTLIGYRQISSGFSSSATSITQVTGLTCPILNPAIGRKIRINNWCRSILSSTAADVAITQLWDGAVGSGTQISESVKSAPGLGGANFEVSQLISAIVTPAAAGLKTYNVGIYNATGARNISMQAASGNPAYISVELLQ